MMHLNEQQIDDDFYRTQEIFSLADFDFVHSITSDINTNLVIILALLIA